MLRPVRSLVADPDVRIFRIDVHRYITMQGRSILQGFTVKMDDPGGAGSLMEVVPVLSDDSYIKVLLQPGCYIVRLVGTQRTDLTSDRVDEVQHCLSFPCSLNGGRSTRPCRPPSPWKVDRPLSWDMPAPNVDSSNVNSYHVTVQKDTLVK